MSALGNHYRWQVLNGTGVSVTVTLNVMLWKFDSSGALVFSSESTPISAATVTANTYENSSDISNATDKYLGAQVTALFDVAAAATGLVSVFIQQSTDGGTTWPNNGQGLLIGSYYFNNSSTDVTKNFRVV